jgi:hypothetical protein
MAAEKEGSRVLVRLFGAVLFAIGCAGGSRLAQAGGPESPQAALDRIAANFSTLDVSAMAALFRPDAALFGSTVPGLLRGPEGARTYFEQAWANAARGTMTCDPTASQQPAPDVVLFATVCRLARPERTSTVRVSGAAMRDGEGWRFAELHVSAQPPLR